MRLLEKLELVFWEVLTAGLLWWSAAVEAENEPFEFVVVARAEGLAEGRRFVDCCCFFALAAGLTEVAVEEVKWPEVELWESCLV